MANTFRVLTFAAEPANTADGQEYHIYTTPSSTTTVVLGLMLCNVDTSQRLVDVHIESDTSDTETNSNVHAIKDAPIPAGSTLKVVSVQKIVLNGGYKFYAYASAGTCDVIASVLEGVS